MSVPAEHGGPFISERVTVSAGVVLDRSAGSLTVLPGAGCAFALSVTPHGDAPRPAGVVLSAISPPATGTAR